MDWFDWLAILCGGALLACLFEVIMIAMEGSEFDDGEPH